jgi:hypothetical protein
MKRIINPIMFLLFLVAIATGIGESSSAHVGRPVAHITIIVLLVLTIGVHIWLNRKAVIKYLGLAGSKPRVSNIKEQ